MADTENSVPPTSEAAPPNPYDLFDVHFVRFAGTVRLIEYKVRVQAANYGLVPHEGDKYEAILTAMEPHFRPERYRQLRLVQQLSNRLAHGDFSEAMRDLHQHYGSAKIKELVGEETVRRFEFESEKMSRLKMSRQESMYGSFLRFLEGYGELAEGILHMGLCACRELSEDLAKKFGKQDLNGEEIFRKIEAFSEKFHAERKRTGPQK